MTRKKPRKKWGSRSTATENKAGTLNTPRAATDRPVGAPINLSNQDIQELKEFAFLSKSTPARPRRNRNHGNRIAVDSGATVSLIKKKEWLGSLQNRIKAHVTTANGSTSQTSGHGPLRVLVEAKDSISCTSRGCYVRSRADCGVGRSAMVRWNCLGE